MPKGDRNRDLPQNQPRTECRRGHPLAGTNAGVDVTGRRWCRACRNRYMIEYKARGVRARRAHHDGHDTTVDSTGRMQCRTCARRELDVDDIAVERAVDGDPPAGLTPAETAAAAIELTRLGRSATWIADLLGCSARTVQRARTRRAALADLEVTS